MESTTKILPDKIRKNGFAYELLERTKKAALYKQYDPKQEKVIGYEVFKIYKLAATRGARLKNKVLKPLPPREKFPCDSDFGRFAWAFTKIDQALVRYNAIK